MSGDIMNGDVSITEEEDQPQNNSHNIDPMDVAINLDSAPMLDTPDGPATPIVVMETPPSPTKRKKEKPVQLDDNAFNELSAASHTRLQDVRKTRPRRPGGHRPTRIGITPQHEGNPGGGEGAIAEEKKVDNGLEDFFKPAPSALTVADKGSSKSGSQISM